MSSFSFLNNIQSNGGIESYSNSKLEYFDVSTGGAGAGAGVADAGGGRGGGARDGGAGGGRGGGAAGADADAGGGAAVVADAGAGGAGGGGGETEESAKLKFSDIKDNYDFIISNIDGFSSNNEKYNYIHNQFSIMESRYGPINLTDNIKSLGGFFTCDSSDIDGLKASIISFKNNLLTDFPFKCDNDDLAIKEYNINCNNGQITTYIDALLIMRIAFSYWMYVLNSCKDNIINGSSSQNTKDKSLHLDHLDLNDQDDDRKRNRDDDDDYHDRKRNRDDDNDYHDRKRNRDDEDDNKKVKNTCYLKNNMSPLPKDEDYDYHENKKLSVGGIIAFALIIIIMILWVIGGLSAFIMSILCFGYNSNPGDNIIGLVIAILVGPFYWIYYSYNKSYCNK